MNKQIIEKWIAALRSGEYQQGTTGLKDKNNYCCLGVLCDLYVKETGKARWEENTPELMSEAFISLTSEETEFLPLEVVKWSGLEKEDPYVFYKDGYNSLVILNDVEKLSFTEIANLIEKEYLTEE